MKINIEDIEVAQKERKRINSANIYDIEFFKGGTKIDITQSVLDDFAFTGLSNIDFITSGFYKTGWGEGGK